jgi:hypothetical protein
MIGHERALRDAVGAAIALLRVIQFARLFAHDAQVVEGVGEVGM